MKREKVENTEAMCYQDGHVVVRPFNIETDLQDVYRWVNDPELNQYIMATHPLTLVKEREWAEKIGKDDKNVIFAIEKLPERKFIGLMGIHNIDWVSRTATTGALIGDRENRGKHLGRKAKMWILHYAFNVLNLRKIESSVLAFNDASNTYLKETGYKEEGVRRLSKFVNGEYHDINLYGIFKEDFEPYWTEYSKDLPKYK